MIVNGKRDGFALTDIRDCGKIALFKRGQAESSGKEIQQVVSDWARFGEDSQIPEPWMKRIAKSHRRIF